MRWKAYSEYKDANVTRLCKVPNNWGLKRLKRCVDLINEQCDDEAMVKFIGLENIQSWTGKIIGSDKLSEGDDQSNFFKSGDVLFNKLRPYLAKVLLPVNNGTCTGELLVFRPKNEIFNKYLFYYLVNNSN